MGSPVSWGGLSVTCSGPGLSKVTHHSRGGTAFFLFSQRKWPFPLAAAGGRLITEMCWRCALSPRRSLSGLCVPGCRRLPPAPPKDKDASASSFAPKALVTSGTPSQPPASSPGRPASHQPQPQVRIAGSSRCPPSRPWWGRETRGRHMWWGFLRARSRERESQEGKCVVQAGVCQEQAIRKSNYK